VSVVVFAILIGLVTVVAVTLPFFVGKGGLLASAAQVNSVEHLDRLKDAILKRYLEDEKARSEGYLSELAWTKRRDFLTNRYIDTVRRRDFVAMTATDQASEVGS